MYFKQPRQLLDIFEELEEQNLFLIQKLPGKRSAKSRSSNNASLPIRSPRPMPRLLLNENRFAN